MILSLSFWVFFSLFHFLNGLNFIRRSFSYFYCLFISTYFLSHHYCNYPMMHVLCELLLKNYHSNFYLFCNINGYSHASWKVLSYYVGWSGILQSLLYLLPALKYVLSFVSWLFLYFFVATCENPYAMGENIHYQNKIQYLISTACKFSRCFLLYVPSILE